MTANLLSRLQGLTAPDREVDAQVHALAIGGRVHFIDDGDAVIERPIDGMWIRGVYPLKGKTIPRYTASLDATVALCKRVLPGWERSMSSIHPDFRGANEPRFTADLAGPISWIKDTETGALEPHCETHCGKGISEAIALLIAILTALEARENG